MSALNLSGWIACIVGSLLWLYGYMVPGTTALIDWPNISPTWISMFMPNLEAELGMLVMCIAMVPLGWNAVKQNSAQ